MTILFETVGEAFLKSLISGDKSECVRLAIEEYNKNKDIKIIYEELLRPAMYQVGCLWKDNKISVAKEHLATAITEYIMSELYRFVLSNSRATKKAVFINAYGEDHRVGLKMVSDIFESHGWDAFVLGGQMPREDIISYVKELMPDIICISSTIMTNKNNILPTIRDMKNINSDFVILLGGQSLSKELADSFAAEFKNIYYIPNLFALDEAFGKNKLNPFSDI